MDALIPAAAPAPAPHQRYPVRTEEDAGAARRAVGRLAAAVGVPPGNVQLAATELATNIVRHARGDGYLLCQAGEGYLELIAADHGPGLGPGGIPPTEAGPRQPEPGTGGGLGIGLGAVRRLAMDFDWQSGPSGTVVLARFGEHHRSWPGLARWGAVNVPLGGAGSSGDAWLVTAGGKGCLIALLVDGLGHGPAAAMASAAALTAVAGQPVTDPGLALLHAHEAMRGTRGGVLGVAVIDPAAGELAYAGVGNISGWVLHDGKRAGLLSREGTAGTQARPPRPYVARLPWSPGATLLLTSDGLRAQHDLDSCARLRGHDPSITAAVLYRDHERGTDDACVLVVQDVRHD